VLHVELLDANSPGPIHWLVRGRCPVRFTRRVLSNPLLIVSMYEFVQRQNR